MTAGSEPLLEIGPLLNQRLSRGEPHEIEVEHVEEVGAYALCGECDHVVVVKAGKTNRTERTDDERMVV